MEYDWHSVVCCCYFYSRYPAAMQGNAEESQQDSYRPHWSDSVFACTFRSRHNGADADVDLTCQASSGCKNSKIIRHHKRGCRTSKLNRSPSSRQLKNYKFFLPAEIYLLAVFMQLASKFRVFPLVLKFRDSFASVYCCSNLYNFRSFLREYLYQ